MHLSSNPNQFALAVGTIRSNLSNCLFIGSNKNRPGKATDRARAHEASEYLAELAFTR